MLFLRNFNLFIFITNIINIIYVIKYSHKTYKLTNKLNQYLTKLFDTNYSEIIKKNKERHCFCFELDKHL